MNLTTLNTLISNTQFACFDELDEITMCIDMSKVSPDKPYLAMYTRGTPEPVKVYEVWAVKDDGTICVITNDDGDDYRDEITLYAPLDKHMIEKLAEEANEEETTD